MKHTKIKELIVIISIVMFVVVVFAAILFIKPKQPSEEPAGAAVPVMWWKKTTDVIGVLHPKDATYDVILGGGTTTGSCDGWIDVSANVFHIDSAASVSGDLMAFNDLIASGAVHLDNTVSVSGDLTVAGTFTPAADTLDWDDFIDVSTLDADLHILSTNDIYASGSFWADENASISGTLNANGNFTISAGSDLIIGAVTWSTTNDYIDGEQIYDDTIDVDSLDWAAFTDLADGGAVSWENIAAGELANDSVIDADIDDDGNFAFTGGWDFGGGVIELPNAAAPTVDATGEIALDTTANQLVWYDTDEVQVLVATKSIGFAISSISDTVNFPFHKSLEEITITAIHCITDPASSSIDWSIDIQICDTSADNCDTVDAAIVCDEDGATDDGAIDSGMASASDWLTASISEGAADTYADPEIVTVTIYYKETRK